MLQPIYDLAGSIFLTIPSGLSLDRIVELLHDLGERSQNNLWDHGNKIKIVFDSYRPEDIVRCCEIVAENSSINLNFETYNSHFFVITQKEAQELVQNDFRFLDFESNFVVKTVDKNSTEDKKTIKQLLLDSYGVKFQSDPKAIIPVEPKIDFINNKFEDLLDANNINCFLVKSKSGEIVGCFGLSNVEYGNLIETQLTAVAGRYTGENNYIGAKKLPILNAAFVSEFVNNPIFGGSCALSLSNSKKPVAQMYTDFGFQRNQYRQGIIVEIL
jgi:hypothetical protein